MRISSVEKALQEFIASEQPRIIAMTGQWGRGKSYFWHRFLTTLPSEHVAGRTYAYVSLFGLENLSALKDALFESAVALDSVGNERRKELGRRESRWSGMRDKVANLRYTAGRYMPQLEKLPKIGELGP